jgi:hypothetical protein
MGDTLKGMADDQVSGSLFLLYLYEVADEIRLEQVREILKAPPAERKPAFRQPAPAYVQFERPPIIEAIEGPTLSSGLRLAGHVTYYDYGVVSLNLELPFSGSWQDLILLSARWMNEPELDLRAADMVRKLVERVTAALVDPNPYKLSEDYVIIYVEPIHRDGKPVCASELVERRGDAIAQIVRGERADFSKTESAEILESRLSYYETDLLVAGWSAALVYDTPEGAAPTIQLLEYANTQLLEFRYYDSVLTTSLQSVYRTLERRGRRFVGWRLASDANRVNAIRLEVRELTERVDNAIKFLSDMFAARLYRMAAVKIGVPDYRALVEQKLQSAGELYGFMVEQFHQRRAFLLELAVVIILLIELYYFFRGIR